jgi:hypothetical protein
MLPWLFKMFMRNWFNSRIAFSISYLPLHSKCHLHLLVLLRELNDGMCWRAVSVHLWCSITLWCAGVGIDRGSFPSLCSNRLSSSATSPRNKGRDPRAGQRQEEVWLLSRNRCRSVLWKCSAAVILLGQGSRAQLGSDQPDHHQVMWQLWTPSLWNPLYDFEIQESIRRKLFPKKMQHATGLHIWNVGPERHHCMDSTPLSWMME